MAAQANIEEPGPNTRASSELQEVQMGKQKVCQDLQKAEDFLSGLVLRNACRSVLSPKSAVPMG